MYLLSVPPTLLDPNYREKTIIVAISLVMSVAIAVAVFYLAFRLCLRHHKEQVVIHHALQLCGGYEIHI